MLINGSTSKWMLAGAAITPAVLYAATNQGQTPTTLLGARPRAWRPTRKYVPK